MGDVYLIGGPELTHPADCQVFVVDGGPLALVDAGAGESFESLVKNIREVGLDPQNLKYALVTHAHIDHIGALAQFQEKYGLEVLAGEGDAPAIETGRGTGAEFYGLPYRPCPVVRRVRREETLGLGRHQLHIIPIPGHTPGSLAIYCDLGKRVLFGQDVHGPYVPAWGADPAQAALSLKKLLALKADILCEGHFGIIQPAAEVETYIRGYLEALGGG